MSDQTIQKTIDVLVRKRQENNTMDPEWFEARLKEKFINQCARPDVATVGWDNDEWQRYWAAQRNALSMYNMVPTIDISAEPWKLIVHRGRTIGMQYKYLGKTLAGHNPVLVYGDAETRVHWLDLYNDGCRRIEVFGPQREIIYYGN